MTDPTKQLLTVKRQDELTDKWVRLQYKVTTSNPPMCVARQAYVTKNTRQANSLCVHAKRTFFLAEVMFTASRKNKVWAIFTAMLALTLTLTLNPNDAVTIN